MTSDVKTVHFKVENNRFIAEHAEVSVNRGETLISFNLQIPGLAFAHRDPNAPDDPNLQKDPIQLLSGHGSFLRSWRVTPTTAALLDFYNQFGTFEYIVWAIRPLIGPITPVPFRLTFQSRLLIHNV